MNDKLSRSEPQSNTAELKPLRSLSWQQIEMIDEAISAVGPYGEIDLIKEKGVLRFVVTKSSHDALKWRPGSLEQGGK